MNVLIVYAHPGKKSYTHYVLEQLTGALTGANHHVHISDLYQIGFQSDMSESEYEREGFGKTALPVSDDVKDEQQKIENADCIFFLYPVWWSDCPAKMKGWFDRVFSVGYAYGYDAAGQQIKRMKTLKSGHAICTAGYSNEYLTQIGIAESMATIMLTDRFGSRFDNKAMTILGGTLDLETVRQVHLEKIREIVSALG